MSPPVRVVTDSTAGLPQTLLARYGISVVPLTVTAGGRSGAEGGDVTSEDVLVALDRGQHVTTSQPGPDAFAHAFGPQPGEGEPSDVVAVLLSGSLSGTCDAARAKAATVVDRHIEVLDSRSTGMGLGFVVLAAARAAERGAPLAEVMAVGREAAARVTVLLYVESLDALRRGGRIGSAAAWLSGVLSVKVLLHVVDGVIEPWEKVRTGARAMQRLEQRVNEVAASGPVDVAVLHLGAPQRAEQLAASLRANVGSLRDLYVTEIGAVVGAHTGAGSVGVAVSLR